MALEEELAESKQQLGQALSRLEQAVTGKLNSGDTSEEVAKLSQALAAAAQRNQDLSQAYSGQTAQIAQSLDKTIQSLNSILEG